jgi:quercetin dioxygenase-like cupin family protein
MMRRCPPVAVSSHAPAADLATTNVKLPKTETEESFARRLWRAHLEASMLNFVVAFAILFLAASASAKADEVEIKGFHQKIKAELSDLGQLAELNGKYRIRVTQTTIDPGGYMHAHLHLGPGLRCVLSGEMTYTLGGTPTIYRAGDCFAETGSFAHESSNTGAAPVELQTFELLPASAPEGKGSAIPVPAK